MSRHTDDSGRTVEGYREYLSLLARQQIDRRFQSKVDLSGVVNQTLYEAEREFSRVHDCSETEQLRWLRRILANNLVDAIRPFTGPTRDATREISMDAALEESSARIADWLAIEQTSPSGRAVRNEDLLHLAKALAALSEDQRRAVECHHLQGFSLADTASRLGRTKAATAGLIYRGLNRLRQILTDED